MSLTVLTCHPWFSKRELIEANSKLSASESVVEATAFSVEGWIIQLSTAITATMTDALSFLLSAISLAWIQAPEKATATLTERRGH